jgi:hypothetical protein
MIDLRDISAVVGKYAPLLGSVISTANPLAGMVVSLIASVFGANKDDPNDIINKINSSENAAQKIKELEIEHKNILSNNQLSDVQSARNREVEITEKTGKRDCVMQIIAILVVIFTFLTIAIIFFHPDNLSNNSIAMVNIISGSIISAFMLIIKYYF